jgi:hypothetical protein
LGYRTILFKKALFLGAFSLVRCSETRRGIKLGDGYGLNNDATGVAPLAAHVPSTNQIDQGERR